MRGVGLGRAFREERGTIAAFLALVFAALAGMAALSVDLGRAWNLDTELQNAVDAAALACASQLDGSGDARNRAKLAAKGGLVSNGQIFATDGAGAGVNIQDGDITFYSDFRNRTEATGPSDALFCEVRIKTSLRRVDFAFASLVGAVTSAEPQPYAIAGMQTAHCKIPPLMICNPNEPSPFDVNAHIGQGVTLKESTGGGLAPGNFGLLALDNQTLSTNEVRDAWARVFPLAQCFGDHVTTKPGQATAIRQGLNMRFDIYPQGTHQVPAGEPPVEQNPMYAPSIDAVKGMKRYGGNKCSETHPQGWKKPSAEGQQDFMGPGQHVADGGALANPDAMGFPRDDCAYNGGSCDTTTGGTHFGDGTWDINTYMAVNHPTVTDLSVIPDLNGDGSLSRYEVYTWEESSMPNNLTEAEPEVNPGPVCNTESLPPGANDRRVITVAVVNCSAVAGTTDVVPDSWIDMFLTEPMGVYDGNNDLYGEIVGPGGAYGSGITRYVLRLVE